MMTERQKQHYKEVKPEQTVSSIKKILDKLNIEVVEQWLPSSYIDTYSLRLEVKGSRIGTNGKGMTKEYARASAYAEFMERLQNCWIVRYYFRFDNKESFYISTDEKMLPIRQVSEMDNAFIHMMLEQRGVVSNDLDERIRLFKKLHKVEERLGNLTEDFVMLPFYSVRKKDVEYLPYNLYMSYYGSNGMCAGNSPEEALIQGFSEIMERYVNRVVIKERLSLPNIPDDYIAKFPAIYNMYRKLKSMNNYTIQLKDGSLNGKYPVAVLVVIEKNTGLYGVKFGCHPDFGVAMERCFTEITQGGDIADYCGKSILNFGNDIVDSDFNISNSFKSGAAQFPYELLVDLNEMTFTEVKDVSGLSNLEILKNIIRLFVEDNKDIFIRDVSYTGFYSYQIIIPTISEMSMMTDLRFEYLEAKIFCEFLLRHPSKITEKNIEVISRVLKHYSHSQIENTFRFLYGNLINFSLPGDEVGLGWLYMLAMCSIYMGDYIEAGKRMNFFWDTVQMKNCFRSDNVYFYYAVTQYADGMQTLGEHSRVLSYLKQFFSLEIIEKLDTIFMDKKLVFIRQYPEYNCEQCNEDMDYKCCDQGVYSDLINKVKKLQLDSCIDSQNIDRLLC